MRETKNLTNLKDDFLEIIILHRFFRITDFESLFDKVNKDRRGLEGKYLRLERVPISTCIQVKGLKDETSEETIMLYFENNRRGGGPVSHVERLEKDQALVYFEEPSSK